ncbi:hypothetical protein F5148DRAFT_3580 [Russula earlei]|uniref:Uncharacterized protein n=1 Tax=Russula earlei TaxID=71964 RepID=A0ACC0UP80_9AGAM|nr:hypothetical protein F5148DRAFT_3580 [Russula earlei]
MPQSSPPAVARTAAPSRAQTAPPILSLLPLVTVAISAGFTALSYLVRLLHGVFLTLLSPFLVVVPITIYLFSPIIVSSKVLLDLFVVLPYRVSAYTAQALYPIYTFLGVACLSGAIIGVGARRIVSFVGWGLLGGIQSPQRSGSPLRARPQKKPSATARGKRRVTVKVED